MPTRPSFVRLPRPVITCIMGEPTIGGNVAQIKNAQFQGAHAFAVHLDNMPKALLTKENYHRIIDATPRPVMMLRYRGNRLFTDEERVALLTETAECGAAAVDFPADTFCESPLEFTTDPAAIDKQKRAIDRVHAIGAEVVMSSHILDRSRTCEQVLEQMKAIESRGADYAKIVTMANTQEEFLEALRTTMALRREMKVPFIHLCGGKFSMPMRFMGPMLGNCLTFCVYRNTPDFISVQPPMENMLRVLQDVGWNINDTE